MEKLLGEDLGLQLYTEAISSGRGLSRAMFRGLARTTASESSLVVFPREAAEPFR
jgi:hypothetical protein